MALLQDSETVKINDDSFEIVGCDAYDTFEIIDSDGYNSPFEVIDPEDLSCNSEDSSCNLIDSGEDESGEIEMDLMVQEINNICQKRERFQSTMVAYQKSFSSMDIKTAVKEHVLPFLPAKSLARFRAVSTEWNQWIASPFLSYRQSCCFKNTSGFFIQHEFEPPEFISLNPSDFGIPNDSNPFDFLPTSCIIRSSSNGLVLCESTEQENLYYVCNPVNLEWKELPLPNCYHGSDAAVVIVCEPSVLNMDAHYKVICAVSLLDQPVLYFEIYSSESMCWRQPDEVCLELGNSRIKENGGFYSEGIVYWVTDMDDKVVAFDLENEVCGVFAVACGAGSNGALGRLGGEVCYVDLRGLMISSSAAVCEIRLYGGAEMRLKSSFQVGFGGFERSSLGGGWRVLGCVEGKVVVVQCGNCVYKCGVEEGRRGVELVSEIGSGGGGRRVAYVNSLVSVA